MIGDAQLGPDRQGRGANLCVSGGMSQLVIGALQADEVENQQGERGPGPLSAAYLDLEVLEDASPVVNPGQSVDAQLGLEPHYVALGAEEVVVQLLNVIPHLYRELRKQRRIGPGPLRDGMPT